MSPPDTTAERKGDEYGPISLRRPEERAVSGWNADIHTFCTTEGGYKMQKPNWRRWLSLGMTGALCLGLVPMSVFAAEGDAVPIYMDPSYSFEERAADLVARMSLEQKGSQMISNNSAAIPASELGGGALNVPATKGIDSYTWWSEALHGYSHGTGATNSTSYPQNLSAGSTWNPDLYYRQAQLISDEIRERTSKSSDGHSLNLTFYSPTVNMQRDPRWGRNEEAFSEDVLLNSVMGSQFVLGMEGKDQNGELLDEDGYYKTITTIKHYTANNSERNRLDGGATMSLRALREYFTAPYRNVIEATDVSSVMTAYSTLNGEPTSMSSYLMDTLLRQTWGFTGYVTSDCDSVSTIARHNYTNPHTGETLTATEQFSQAMAHGEDLECSGGYNSGVGNYASNISDMVSAGVDTDKGTFTENQVDISLHRLMTARMKTGEFDENVSYDMEADARKAQQQADAEGTGKEAYWQTDERIQAAEDTAEEAVVLLQNNGGLLPLDASVQSIAIVGSWQTDMYLGVYSAGQNITENHVNIQQGITDAMREVNPDIQFTYINSNTLTAEDEQAIRDADVAIVVTGTNSSYSAEDRDRTTITLPNNQADLISQVGQLNDSTIAIMETCGPMEVATFQDDVEAILWSSFGGIRKGVGFGRVISGAVNPSGKVTATWHQTVNDNGPSDIPAITDYNIYATEGDPGRTYMYYEGNDVSYPFGYGMSYTTYEYSNLKITNNGAEADAFDANDTITVSFDVTNTGDVAGKEVVQLYVAQPEAPEELLRPIKRLEGFDKIELQPGETKTVTLDVVIEDLAYYNEEEDRYIVDTGLYEIQVGGSSQDISLTGRLTVSGAVDVIPAVLSAKPNQEGDTEDGVEERLIFDIGKTVYPQLTVAMNDESLYGYIIANQMSPIKQMENNVPFPEGMTFTYSSNRPDVVAVDGDVITTVAPGVATITATATYNGVTVSTDFVVYVESTPYLEDITVDGASIPEFRNNQLNYSYAVDGASIPTVGYEASNADLTVQVTQAAAIPGVATIDVSNTRTGEQVQYRIGFGTAATTADFTAGQPEGWTFINGDAANASFGAGGLTITAQDGSFADGSVKNLFVTPAFGDWVAQTQMTLGDGLGQVGQQAGLVVYDNAGNSLRVAYERTESSGWWGQVSVQNELRVYSITNGAQRQIASATLDATSLGLQIVKRGNAFSFMYSTDGNVWNTLSEGNTVFLAYPQVGVYASSGSSGESFQAGFNGMTFSDVNALYPRLSAIQVDGEALIGFNPEQFTYNFAIAEGSEDIHTITGTAADPNHSVTVEPLTAPAGTARITVASEVASVTYSISYNYGPKSDYFADGGIGSQWEILRPDDTAYDIVQGQGIVMPTQQGDVHSTGGAWKNCFVMPAMGNWEVVAKVFYPQVPTGNYQQAMLLVWQDEDNYVRLNCQQDSLRLEPGVELNGAFAANGLNQAYASASDDGTVTLYYKIRKDGLNYSLSYSQDGTTYIDLGTAENIDFSDPKIGLFATQNSNVTPINVYFEYLTVTNLNGVEQISYADMLRQATENVLDYAQAAIPTQVSSDLVLPAVPHGYTLTLNSSDPGVIDADGKVYPADEDKTVTLTLSVTDGISTAASDPISVTVLKSGETPDPTDELTASVNGASVAGGNERVPYVFSYTGEDEDLGNVTLRFTVAGEPAGVLTANYVMEGLNGFQVLAKNSKSNGDGTTTYTVVLAYNLDETSTEEVQDILSFVLRTAESQTGEITVTLNDAIFTYTGDPDLHYAEISGAPAVTQVVAVRYDINGDGVFNQADITAAQGFYRVAQGDADWDEAKKADVNGDGVITVDDLVELSYLWLDVLG